MYEKISSELFSCLIEKINQIPNYSTPYKTNPSSKDPKKLSHLYHLYNFDSSDKDLFSKIFSSIYDYNLKNNLVKIMLNIGTKYNSFSTSNANSILIKDANDELLALFANTWSYFNKKSEYLKEIDLEGCDSFSEEFKEYEKSFKETVCFACGLINIVIFMFKKQFSVLNNYNSFNNSNLAANINKIHTLLNKEYIQTEINMLFIMHKNRIWLEPVITLLEQILKFFLDSNFYSFINIKMEKYRKKEKEGGISKEEIIKKINSHINYIIDDNKALIIIFTLVVKYSSLNNANVLINSILQIKDLNDLIQRFFNIYIIFLMNESYLCISLTEEQIFCMGINIINCILNSKYKDPNYGVDFTGYFYATETFIKDIFDEICMKIINGINELNGLLRAGCMNIQFPNLNLLQKLENTLKDYILYTMISGYNKDSLCDCYMNYEKQRMIFLSFGLIRTYLLMCKSIKKALTFDNIINIGKNDENNNEKKRQIIIGNIFDILINEIKKYNIVLPIKMFLYKSYIIQGIFVVLHKFVKIFNKSILNFNTDRFIFYNNISIIKEMTESVNYLYFMLGNDILNYLRFPVDFKKNNMNNQISNPLLLPFLRIIDQANPINYYNIIQEQVPNNIKNSAQSKKIKYIPPMQSSILHSLKKKSSNILSNKTSLFDKNKDNRDNLSNLKDNLRNDSSDDSMESIDNNNDNGYTILPTNIFKSNIYKSEVKHRNSFSLNNFLYRYDVTDFVNSFNKEFFPFLKRIGYECKKENDKYYIYIISEDDVDHNVSQIICVGKNEASGISLQNANLYNLIKNEPLTNQILDQLYVNLLDGIEESNKGKNIENTLKYYDVNFNMNYFSFVEKCKEFLL